MSNVKVNFGSSIDTFKNVGPPPFVSVSSDNVYTNETMHTVDRVTLSGRLKKENGCTGGFEELYQKASGLIANLNKNFDTLSILESDGSTGSTGSTGASGSTGGIEGGPFNTLYEWDYAIVRSISFDDNKWYDWVPYTIEFDCYKNGYFASDGIINPTRTVSYDTQNDNIVSLTISCSCNGINNSNQAIENARAFADINSDVLLADITQSVTLHPNIKNANYFNPSFPEKKILKSVNESIDRLAGTVSVQKTYLLQEEVGVSNGILRFTRSLNTSENGEATVSINGSIEDCIDRERELGGGYSSDTTLDMIEDDIKNKNWYTIANELYLGAGPIGAVGSTGSTGSTGATGSNLIDPLYSAPYNFSITRNPDQNSVNFSLEYSNKINNDITIVDTTTITNNYETSTKCIEVSLAISSSLKNHEARWDSVVNYFNSFDMIEYVKRKWAEYGNEEELNLNVNNTSYSEDKFQGSIQVTASFCASKGEGCGCLQNMQYSYQFVPPLNEYKVGVAFGGKGCHFVEDIDCLKRASFTLAGRLLQSTCCSYEKTVMELKNKVNQISNYTFFGEDKILEASEISSKKPNGEISFSFTWSAEKPKIIPENIQ